MVLTAEGVVGGVPPVALVEPAAAGGVTGGASVPVAAEGAYVVPCGLPGVPVGPVLVSAPGG